jgi:tetratricopeptide (TPR) repeat protein
MKLSPAISALAALLLLAALPRWADAFRYADIGSKLPQGELATLDGRQRPILDSTAAVNVLLFFRPNQDRSRDALTVLTRVCDKYANRGVRCVALVSDYYGRKEVQGVTKHAAWPADRTLIDEDERYAGQLGVSLHPSIGLADGARTLLAYEPYAQINYTQRIEAQIEYALGDINLEQLRAALDPPVLPRKQKNRAKLNLYYALRLYETGKLDRALATAQQAIHIDDSLDDAYALIGVIHLRRGDCRQAKIQFDMALSRDADNTVARIGNKICR